MFGAPIGGEWGGLFSDLARVPYADAMLVPLPPGLDPIAMASASDNWSLAWRLVGPHLAERPGGTVLILSGGSIGLYVCDIAGALGASRRLFVDRDPDRRAIAAGYGAETAETTDPIHQGFDIAVEATGRVEALATACRSLVPEGICESAGNHFHPGELSCGRRPPRESPQTSPCSTSSARPSPPSADAGVRRARRLPRPRPACRTAARRRRSLNARGGRRRPTGPGSSR